MRTTAGRATGRWQGWMRLAMLPVALAFGISMPGAAEALADPAIDRVVVTDAVPPFRLTAGPARDKLEIMSAAPLLAEAVRRLHIGEPLSDLFVF